MRLMADTKADDTSTTDVERPRHLSPENRRMREWIDAYMSKPLTEEEHRRWEERKRFAEENPLMLRGADES